MMNILDILKEQQSKKKYYTEKTDAQRYFEKQQKAIKAITNTTWYHEIQEYWKRVAGACNERLRTMKTDKEMFRIQGELDTAMAFLDFLDNLQWEDLDEDEDILNSN